MKFSKRGFPLKKNYNNKLSRATFNTLLPTTLIFCSPRLYLLFIYFCFPPNIITKWNEVGPLMLWKVSKFNIEWSKILRNNMATSWVEEALALGRSDHWVIDRPLLVNNLIHTFLFWNLKKKKEFNILCVNICGCSLIYYYNFT